MKGEFYKMEYEAWDEAMDHLTLEQETCALRLIHQMYRRRGAVPNHLPTLARLWRSHPNKARGFLKTLLDDGIIKLTPEGDLINTRVRRELDARDTQRTKASHAGQTGGRRSGEVRRKSLENKGSDEANASNPSNENEAEERRGEKIREEEKEKEDARSVEVPDFLAEFRMIQEQIEASEAKVEPSSDDIVFSRGVVRLTQGQIDELKAAFRHIKFDRELGATVGFVERKFNENRRAGKPEPWWDILWASLAKKDRDAEEAGQRLKAKVEAEAAQAAKAGTTPRKVKLI